MVEPTHLKNMLVKLDHFPRDPGENKKYLSCHHLGVFPRYTLWNNWGDDFVGVYWGYIYLIYNLRISIPYLHHLDLLSTSRTSQ